jgi:hypothetical protein
LIALTRNVGYILIVFVSPFVMLFMTTHAQQMTNARNPGLPLTSSARGEETPL